MYKFRVSLGRTLGRKPFWYVWLGIVVFCLIWFVAQWRLLLLPGDASATFMDSSTGTAAGPASTMASSSSGAMMMMQMWFEASTHVTLWFKQWRTDGPAWYAVSCIGLAVLCILQEALAYYRVNYARHAGAALSGSSDAHGASQNDMLPERSFLLMERPPNPLTARLVLTLLYGANVASSYLLMLAVMTYNVGYFVIIVASLAIGHCLFAAKPALGKAMSSEACCPQPV